MNSKSSIRNPSRSKPWTIQVQTLNGGFVSAAPECQSRQPVIQNWWKLVEERCNLLRKPGACRSFGRCLWIRAGSWIPFFFFEENVWVFFKSWLFLGPAFFEVMMFWPSRCASAPLCVFWTFYNDTGGAESRCWERIGPVHLETDARLKQLEMPHCQPTQLFDRNWSSGTSWDAPLYNIRVKDVMSSRYCGIA